MNIYHLLWHPETNRLVIEGHIIKGYESQKTTRASCWIDAKKKLGFELTSLQEEMLNAQNLRDKASRWIVRNIKDARPKLRPANRELPDRSEVGEGSRERLQQLLRDEGVLQGVCAFGEPCATEEVDFNQ